MNIGNCLARSRKRHPILARPDDKSGMTLKPCASAQLHRDLKIGNILDTTKNSSASCVFIIRLLKRSGEPGGRSTGVVYKQITTPKKSNIFQPTSQYIFICHRSIYSSAIEYYAHLPSSIMLICHRVLCSFAIEYYAPLPSQYIFQSRGNELPAGNAVLSMQPVTVSVSAPVILSVLRDGGQDDRYRKSGKNGHGQPAGVMPP